jgi:hypothetical protein
MQKPKIKVIVHSCTQAMELFIYKILRNGHKFICLLLQSHLYFQTKHINVPHASSPVVPAILASSGPGNQTVLDRYSPRGQGTHEQIVCWNAGGLLPIGQTCLPPERAQCAWTPGLCWSVLLRCVWIMRYVSIRVTGSSKKKPAVYKCEWHSKECWSMSLLMTGICRPTQNGKWLYSTWSQHESKILLQKSFILTKYKEQVICSTGFYSK